MEIKRTVCPNQTDEKKALKVMERFRSADSNSLNELLAIIDFHRETDLTVSWRDGLERVTELSHSWMIPL